nr:SusD/RagB family nutrient-binding outer membrane lipoprotein [uncultured Bacteroides sp.]
MKRILSIIFASLLIFSSCTNFEELNTDPNNPTVTHPRLLLTNICWNTFSENSLDPLYASKYIVQSDGENSEQFYKWNRGSFSYYTNLKDVNKMQEEAENISANGYVALAHFFRAYYFYNLTMTFGDIPYSEALKGESVANYTPVYDTQENVFKGILSELKTANEILSKESDNLSGDIIFGGDITKWKKTVNAFRLKVLLTLSKRANDASSTVKSDFAVIVNSGLLMTSSADNAQLVYLDQEGNRYPMFNSSTFGSGMYMDSTFVSLLADKKDPRLFTFCTQTKNAKSAGLAVDNFSSYDGGDPAAPYATVNAKAVAGNISKPHSRFYASATNEPQILMGYSEQELIIAEAIVRGWITGDAAIHYEAAVRASFKFYETYASDYASYLNETAATAYIASPENSLTGLTTEQKIERIVDQKYIQSYFQGMWTPLFEHLRTGYPAFRRPTGVEVPKRWMYPQAEYNNNATNVKAALDRQFGGLDRISDALWWEK